MLTFRDTGLKAAFKLELIHMVGPLKTKRLRTWFVFTSAVLSS